MHLNVSDFFCFFMSNRIEKMWIRDGAGYFFGPIFIHPEETEHEPTKMFYKKEVFLSNLEEACPMTCIIGSLNTNPAAQKG